MKTIILTILALLSFEEHLFGSCRNASYLCKAYVPYNGATYYTYGNRFQAGCCWNKHKLRCELCEPWEKVFKDNCTGTAKKKNVCYPLGTQNCVAATTMEAEIGGCFW